MEDDETTSDSTGARTEKSETDPWTIERGPYGVLLAGGISSLSLVAVLQFLGQDELDLSLKLSLYCFVYALPIATASFVALTKTTAVLDPMFKGAQRVFTAVYITAQIAFAFGITAVMFHFSLAAGMLFICSFVLAIATQSLAIQFRKPSDLDQS